MSERLKYVIFKTKWGYFGLLSSNLGLLRTCLPVKDAASAKKYLLDKINNAQYDKNLEKGLQKKVIAYFNGSYVDFSDISVDLSGYSDFSRKVLSACRKITAGQTNSYGGLGEAAGNGKAGRAVGNILGKNRLPLIIPCHRVIKSDGQLGGFSAGAGPKLKAKLLELEKIY